MTGTLFIAPPGPGSFSCPPGQTLTFVGVTYTDVQVADNTTGQFVDIPGTFNC